MATQTFMPEMQAITPGNVQQTPPSAQQQQQQQNSGGVVSATVSGQQQSSQQQQVPQQQTQSQTRNQSQTSASNATSGSQTQSSGNNGGQVNVAVGQQQAGNNQQAQQQQQQQQQQSTIVQVTQPSQQFIAVAVSEDENTDQDTVTLQNATQAVHSTYVQYVEGSTDPNIYAATNGQMAYPVYCVSDTNTTMYTPATAYYNAGNSTAVTYSQDGGVAYLVQGSSVDSDGHHLTHATRVSPATVSGGRSVDDGDPLAYPPVVENRADSEMVFGDLQVQWLLDNYETAEGVSLPRSTLYNHYLRHCADHKLDPVNAASFGKLIRSVFLGLRTRRLGTRGNSKYHYYGIRVKPNSPLNQLTEEVGTMALRQQPMNQGKRFKPAASQKVEPPEGGATAGTHSQTSSSSSDSTSPQQQQHQQFLGDASSAIPNLGDVDLTGTALPDGILPDDIHSFKVLYKEHCEAFLDAVINLQFSMVEILWQQFWRTQCSDPDPTDIIDIEKRLSKTKLYLMCKWEPVQQFVRRGDYQFYQNLVEVLIPDVLRPIPSSLTQAIRNFAKSLEGWLTSAMADSPEEMVKVKISAVSAFAQTLRRYTSLNHLAQAARAVLQNSSQINQMLADLNRVDFHNVQEQASWVCQCDDGMVQKLEHDFKLTLQQQNSLEQWAAWLEGVVAQVLKSHEGKVDFARAARQFLLKWSFYSSMVIRDLTLRSAASFGSFHLIRLLYDEYMFYLIEHRVAIATGETPIAVMGEFIGLGQHKLLTNSKPLVTGVLNTTATNGHSGVANSLCPTTTVVAQTGQKIVMLGGGGASGAVAATSTAGLSNATSGGHIAKRLKSN